MIRPLTPPEPLRTARVHLTIDDTDTDAAGRSRCAVAVTVRTGRDEVAEVHEDRYGTPSWGELAALLEPLHPLDDCRLSVERA